MTEELEQRKKFSAVARQLAPLAEVLSVRRLLGGVSADVHALEIQEPSLRPRTVVVRQHGTKDVKGNDGQMAATVASKVVKMEHELLHAMSRAGLPVPQPLLLDVSGDILDSAYLVMDFVTGSTELGPGQLPASLQAMAATLGQLHQLDASDFPEVAMLPPRLDPLPEVFGFIPAGSNWDELRTTLSNAKNTLYVGVPRILHGDFWPGNLLWHDGQLVAILDWEDAALGDPIADVAGARMELLWKHGDEAMTDFTAAYTNILSVDSARLALWEIYVGLAAARYMGDWGLPVERVADMRVKTERFVRSAETVLRKHATQ